jgi:hypothetical protein
MNRRMMRRTVMSVGLLWSAMIATADAQTKVRLGDFEISDGNIEAAAGNRLMVGTKEMRATLKRAGGSQHVSIPFTYLGPSSQVSHLGNGEVRHQFGIILKARTFATWCM